MFFTARIERPPLYRGGSASKKNGLPAPSPHSEAARCASTEDRSAPIPLSSSRRIRRHEHEDFETLCGVILHAMLFPGRRHGSLPWTEHLFL